MKVMCIKVYKSSDYIDTSVMWNIGMENYICWKLLITMSNYRAMRFQILKIGQNLHANMVGFCRDGHNYKFMMNYS